MIASFWHFQDLLPTFLKEKRGSASFLEIYFTITSFLQSLPLISKHLFSLNALFFDFGSSLIITLLPQMKFAGVSLKRQQRRTSESFPKTVITILLITPFSSNVIILGSHLAIVGNELFCSL